MQLWIVYWPLSPTKVLAEAGISAVASVTNRIRSICRIRRGQATHESVS